MEASSGPRFSLGEELGSGAVASVHRVQEVGAGRTYAGKILHERHRRDAAAAARFAREAELASQLSHPNLVGVRGVVELDGQRVLLMELVEGRTLAQLVACDAPVAERELIAIARGIANGLWVAHGAGIIHRDLKPANVLLDEGEHGVVPKIADFGMARATSFAGSDRGALTVLGTPGYMAPECLDPLAVDPRADLYALGCILFEMATGRPPFSGPTPFAILEGHRGGEIPSLPDGYSKSLRRLTRRLLSKQPGDRPQSAWSVVERLSTIERELDDSTALVPAAAHEDMVAAVEGRCARCGNPLVPAVGTCFHCGLPLIRLGSGPMTVFVVGPGRVSEKLQTKARDRLLTWVRENPSVGLDPTPLAASIPRVPFVFAAGVDEAAARALAGSLGQLGVKAELRRGGRFSHEGMLKKSALLGGRRSALVAAIGFAPAVLHPMLGLMTLLGLTPVLPLIFGVTASRAAKPVMHVLPAARDPLPDKIAARLERLREVVPKLTQPRHREGLRSVVQRVLALTESTPADERVAIEPEMDHALNLAIVGTQRMDELDRLMSRPEFDAADPDHRRDLHERDTWAARLLDLAATLDGLASRQAAAQARLRGPDLDEALEKVRANVEALEEVHRLN